MKTDWRRNCLVFLPREVRQEWICVACKNCNHTKTTGLDEEINIPNCPLKKGEKK